MFVLNTSEVSDKGDEMCAPVTAKISEVCALKPFTVPAIRNKKTQQEKKDLWEKLVRGRKKGTPGQQKLEVFFVRLRKHSARIHCGRGQQKVSVREKKTFTAES